MALRIECRQCRCYFSTPSKHPHKSSSVHLCLCEPIGEGLALALLLPFDSEGKLWSSMQSVEACIAFLVFNTSSLPSPFDIKKTSPAELGSQNFQTAASTEGSGGGGGGEGNKPASMPWSSALTLSGIAASFFLASFILRTVEASCTHRST